MTTESILGKLSHLPPKSQQAITGFAGGLIEAFGDNLTAILLFGSAARTTDDFKEGASDINIAIVLKNVSASELNIILNIGRKYNKSGLAIPLVFSGDHITTSLDTFPLEFSDMKNRHICLYGTDPLEKAKIETANLRHQCEVEFKGKLVQLRRGYLAAGEHKEDLRRLISTSVTSILAACRGLVHMKGQTASQDTLAPDSVGDLLRLVKDDYGIDIAPLERAWRLKRGEAEESTATLQLLFDNYLNVIEQLALMVDRL